MAQELMLEVHRHCITDATDPTDAAASTHAAPWAWHLVAGEAASLAASATPRWLRVEEGSLWVTARDAGPAGQDLWLCAGDSLSLPAGSAWVLQAWPQARVAVMWVAPVGQSRFSARFGAGLLSWVSARLSARFAPATSRRPASPAAPRAA